MSTNCLKGFSGPDSYQFGFVSLSEANPLSRHEERDSSGQVRGYYSFKDPNGLINYVQYQATKSTGFKITRQLLINPNTGKIINKIKNRIKKKSRRRKKLKRFNWKRRRTHWNPI